ncbi:WD domain, G-beta repeat, putative [Trypanosoma equiperdum]|uniref:WD domain, G-beta repeat, putative n=2 Tax=Trypanozoon TaxID=39700 RepID=A0A1G4I7B8_TRYEQ|nr:WD domain, G-beta repeat, putative [Trypanosoma equiperdum]
MQQRSISPGRGRVVPRGQLTRSARGSTISCSSPQRPQAVVNELHRRDGTNPTTDRGRQIAEEVDELMNEVYGGTAHQPPPESLQRHAEGGNLLARYKTSILASALPTSWQRGPSDPAGLCFDASDRNLLCMDVYEKRGLCVVGSADHGLKVFDLATGAEKRNLYTKKYGHTEWVTCCKFLPDSGKILSGGMDSKLCLWEASGPARCTDLTGHTGSISQVEVCGNNGFALSSSYDRTLRLWDCGAGGRCIATFAGHKAPVMMFSWCGTQLLSGDRQGTAKMWDVESGECLATMATKRGQIGSLWHTLHTSVGLLSAIGDQGGVLTVMDFPRTGSRPIFQGELHPGGVISSIRSVDETPYLITAGADKVILTLDPRAGFAVVHNFTDHRDFIYSMETFGPLVLSGGGNGWLLVHNVLDGKCCYGLGANGAAVREIRTTSEYLVAAGDDGKAMVYSFN